MRELLVENMDKGQDKLRESPSAICRGRTNNIYICVCVYK